MKLSEVTTRDPVRDDHGGPSTYFAERAGYSLEFSRGLVTIGHANMKLGRIVPVGNVVTMTPAAVEAVKKPGPRAA